MGKVEELLKLKNKKMNSRWDPISDEKRMRIIADFKGGMGIKKVAIKHHVGTGTSQEIYWRNKRRGVF